MGSIVGFCFLCYCFLVVLKIVMVLQFALGFVLLGDLCSKENEKAFFYEERVVSHIWLLKEASSCCLA